jgi:hypothetical protein
MTTTATLPLRRNSSCLVQKEMAGELMLFDPSTKKTHCLNRAAATVWQHADGTTSIEQLTRIVAEETASPIDVRVVEYALRKLDEEGLMEHAGELTSNEANLARRQLFARLGWAAGLLVAVPLITTVTAPKAYALSAPPL